MHNGLLAPQFGLVKPNPHREPRPERQALEALFAPPPTPSGPAPVVIVKRRRLMPSASETVAEAPPTAPPVAEEAAPLPSREARVFLKTEPGSPAPEVPASEAQASASLVDGTESPVLPAVPVRRRRRDPLKAPVLVQHIVFEAPPVAESTEPVPLDEPSMLAVAADGIPARGLPHFIDPGATAEYQQVRAALRALSETVARYEQASKSLAQLEAAMQKADRRRKR